MNPEQIERRAEFHRLMNAIPDVPKGERIRLAAQWMLSSPGTIYIWMAPQAKKAPSDTKIALLRREMGLRGLRPVE